MFEYVQHVLRIKFRAELLKSLTPGIIINIKPCCFVSSTLCIIQQRLLSVSFSFYIIKYIEYLTTRHVRLLYRYLKYFNCLYLPDNYRISMPNEFNDVAYPTKTKLIHATVLTLLFRNI